MQKIMDGKTFMEAISKRTGRDGQDVTALIDALAGVIKERCGKLDSVAVPGFGAFEARRRAERVTTNPATGKKTLIPPKVVLTFKPSALLKSKLKDI